MGQHIHKALTTLEESGQADDTIVLFCPEHGEYAGADGSPIDPKVITLPAGLVSVLGDTPQDFIAAKFDELNVLMTKLESEML